MAWNKGMFCSSAGDHGQIQWRAAKSGQVGAASGRAAADEG